MARPSMSQKLQRPITCEVEGCRKRVTQVTGYWHEWGKRVDMRKGMVPCFRQRLFFSCSLHCDDGSEEQKLGTVPVSTFDAKIGGADG